MGSCFSKGSGQTLGEKSGDTPSAGNPRSSHTNTNRNQTLNEKSGGHQLGGNNSDDSKDAAARAAEMRFNLHQQSKKESELKLQSMKKMSRSEKGL